MAKCAAAVAVMAYVVADLPAAARRVAGILLDDDTLSDSCRGCAASAAAGHRARVLDLGAAGAAAGAGRRRRDGRRARRSRSAEVDDKALEQPAPIRRREAVAGAVRGAPGRARRPHRDAADRRRGEGAGNRARGARRKGNHGEDPAGHGRRRSPSWYQANQARVQGAPLDQVRQPISRYLTQQRMQDVREQYLDTLKAKTPVA